jgi:hypothetical protein
MTDIEAFVWHDRDGTITAVGHAVGGSARIVEPLAGEGQQILKLTVDEEQLGTLHLTHSVDVDNARLIPVDPDPTTSTT